MHIKPHEPLASQLLDAESQQSRIWLERVIRCTCENDAAYLRQLCRATLSCLRRMLPYSAGATLADRLPLIVRGMWYEKWLPNETTLTCSTITEFVSCVRPFLRGHYAEAVMEEDVLAVLRSLFETYPAAADIACRYLPEDLIRERQSEE